MIARGKHHNVAVTAVARELLGFVWAIACEAERQMDRPAAASGSEQVVV